MKLSARNQLKGKILKIEEGLITAKVVIDLGNDNFITSIISKDAIADLNLKQGDVAFAIVKSTEIIIGIPQKMVMTNALVCSFYYVYANHENKKIGVW